MTRKEAIIILKDLWAYKDPNHTEKDIREALEKAIKALEQEPCDYYDTYNKTCRRSEVPKEPCEDAISRTELLKAIDTWDKFGCDVNGKLVPYQDKYISYIHYDNVIKCIKGMPSVTPQAKTGHWITRPHIYGVAFCSECGFELRINDTKYCPNCGAKMESEDTEEQMQKEEERLSMIYGVEEIEGVTFDYDILDKIRAKIEQEEKWLMSAGYNAYNVDIAFSAIKSVLAESEE